MERVLVEPADQLETGQYAIDPADVTKKLVRIVQRNDRRTIVGFENTGANNCWFSSSQSVSPTQGKKLVPGSVFVLDNYIGDIWVAADPAGATVVDTFGAIRSAV